MAPTGSSCWCCPSSGRSSRSRPTSRVAAVRRSSAPCGRSCCPCCDGPPPLALCSDHHHWPFPDRTATTSLTYACRERRPAVEVTYTSVAWWLDVSSLVVPPGTRSVCAWLLL